MTQPATAYTFQTITPALTSFSKVVTRELTKAITQSTPITIEDFPSLLEGFRNGDHVTLKAIYRFVYPQVEQYVVRNSGSMEEARDLFQETMMIAFQQVSHPDFKLSCRLSTYLIAISRKNWMRKLRDDKPSEIRSTHVLENLTAATEALTDNFEQKELLFHQKLQELPPRDRELMELYLAGASTRTIMKHFGYTSPAYVRKRKCQCKAELKRLIEKELVAIPQRYSE